MAGINFRQACHKCEQDRLGCVFQDKRLRVPWLSFATSFPLYALAVANLTFDYGFSTMFLCLPMYFRDILHFDIETVS